MCPLQYNIVIVIYKVRGMNIMLKKVLLFFILGVTICNISVVGARENNKITSTKTTYFEQYEWNGKKYFKELSKEKFDAKKEVNEKLKKIKKDKKKNVIDEQLVEDIMSLSEPLTGIEDGGGDSSPTTVIANPNGTDDMEKNHTKKTEVECFESTINYCAGNALYYVEGNLSKLELHVSLEPEEEYVDVTARLTWIEPTSQSHTDYFSIFYSDNYYPIDTSIYRKTLFNYDYSNHVYDVGTDESYMEYGTNTFDETVFFMNNSNEFTVPYAGLEGGIRWDFEPYIDWDFHSFEGREIYHDHQGCIDDGDLVTTAELDTITYTLGMRLRTKDSNTNRSQNLLLVESTYQHKIRLFDPTRPNAFTNFNAIFKPSEGLNVIEESFYYKVDSDRRTTVQIDMFD
jgi:hypothetical protein